MAWAIADLELTQPLPELVLGPEENGALLLLRAHGRPIHRTILGLEPGARVGPDELWRFIGRDAGRAMLEDAVRRELIPPVEAAPIDVTAAICTRGRPELLEECLRSVLALGVGEILVVDNDPPDDATRRLVAGLSGVRYLHEPRPGLDFARNTALGGCSTAWLAFLDDDVTVDHGWLAGLGEAVAEHPDAAAVTGLVLPAELATPAQVAFEARGGFGRGCHKLRYAGRTLPGQPFYPLGAGVFGAGCNMALRTDVLLELGGFDEALDTGRPLPGGGDLDIFFRVLHAGHPLVYEPRMLAFHRHRRDHAGLRRQYWSWGEGFVAFLDKTVRAEPALRLRGALLMAWWLRYQAREIARSATIAHPLTPDLTLAELAGGIVGMTGAYRRSRKRVDRIRAEHG